MRTRKVFDLVLLLLALGVLVMARLGQTQGSQVSIAGFQSPSLCWWQASTGVDCASCGLTRSFVSMAQGSLRQSFRDHFLGPVFFLLVALQVPYRLFVFVFGRSGREPSVVAEMGLAALLSTGLTAGIYWALQLLTAHG